MKHILIIACLTLVHPLPGLASELIINARVVDGTGAPALTDAAVRIDGNRIVAVGPLTPLPGETVIDARGQVLAPGFIDTHSHHDEGIFKKRDVPEAVSQGITTIVAGQDGGSDLPLKDFFARLQKTPASINVASYSGHGTLRTKILGRDFKRAATPKEITAMRALLAREMRDGALGLSTGLEYDEGNWSTTAELVELSQEVASFGGRYISHQRSEDIALDAAIGELLEIGKRACLPVQISHFKIALIPRWGDAPAVLARLDAARAQGIDVTADVYPYEHWQSTLSLLFPNHDYTNRVQAENALRTIAAAADLTLSQFDPDPSLVGKNVAQIAKQRNQDEPATLMDLIGEAQRFGKDGGSAIVIARSMDAKDVAALLAWPQSNVSSDGSLNDLHPRGAGAFTRVLRMYVREQRILSLEAAIHKMSALAAAHVGIEDRGTIRAGAFADLVMFDPATVTDRATFEKPGLLSTGISRVWVNGRTVWIDGLTTQIHPGLPLRRNERAPPFTCH